MQVQGIKDTSKDYGNLTGIQVFDSVDCVFTRILPMGVDRWKHHPVQLTQVQEPPVSSPGALPESES